MTDLVGTCPKDFWKEWIAEGDAAGDPETGEEWGWYTRHHLVHEIEPGDRFYVVAHGKLRGWAPVVNVDINAVGSGVIERRGRAVACTIGEPIPGFRGLRKRWWSRDDERPFPGWKTEGVMTAAETSRAALESVDISARQEDVLAAIQAMVGADRRPSDRDIADYLGWPINRVTPRRGELVSSGLVALNGKKRGASGRLCRYWTPSPQQLGLFPDRGLVARGRS